MKIGYNIGKLTCSYDDGLVIHVESFAEDLENYCKTTSIMSVDDGTINKTKHVLKYMSKVRDNPELYTMLADLLKFYAIHIQEEADSNGIDL